MSDNHSPILIKKASGHTEAFDAGKLKSSLRNAGAAEDAIREVVAEIESWVYDGVTTSQIYSRAFRIFRQISTSGALLYRLKQAILEMGPSGYPFEHFVGELYRRQGYEVEVGIVMEGASVSHEMDVVASKDGALILGECKYSHKQGFSVSIQVPLYVHSRVNDIVEKLQREERYKGFSFIPWIFTNGRFTSDSTQYSRCKGINLMSWDQPRGHALKDLIEKEMMFPITILGSLTKAQKSKLMLEGIVTCDQLSAHADRLDQLGLEKPKSSVLKELEALAEIRELKS